MPVKQGNDKFTLKTFYFTMFSSFNLLLIKHSRYLCSGSKRKKSPTQKIYGNVEDPKRESIPSA